MKFLTIVLRVPDDYKPEEVYGEYFSAASWSHALDERDSYKVDAERYRWLRDAKHSNREPHVEQYPAQPFDEPKLLQIRDVGLDVAIDFAMTKG